MKVYTLKILELTLIKTISLNIDACIVFLLFSDFRLNNGFLQATSVLDYETQIVHIFNVTVFDGLTHVNAPVTVHVMPVNEFIPQVNLRENPVDVIEGTKRKNICLNVSSNFMFFCFCFL